MKKLKIDKLILVEGKYDKIRLENIVDADIFVLNGFGVFKNKRMINTIKNLACNREVLILTDSDTAGYKIRVYLTKILSNNKITNIFVPQIEGKEKRKTIPSAQGYLGVEGISDEILISLFCEHISQREVKSEITFLDLYKAGYTGIPGSSERKNKLLTFLGVQTNISNTFLLKILNERYTLDEFKKINIDI